MVPPVIIHFHGIFHYKPSSYGGTPMDMETSIWVVGNGLIMIDMSNMRVKGDHRARYGRHMYTMYIYIYKLYI